MIEEDGRRARRTLRVQGHANVQVRPDRATITVGVMTQDPSIHAALADNAAAMHALIEAITALGLSTEQLSTTSFHVGIHRIAPHEGRDVRVAPGRLRSTEDDAPAYAVSHQLRAHLENLEQIGEILDAAVSAGANVVGDILFSVHDPAAAREQALQAAVADARRRAESMASAMGVRVLHVISAAESEPGQPGWSPLLRSIVGPQEAPRTPVQIGEFTIGADVEVVYAIE